MQRPKDFMARCLSAHTVVKADGHRDFRHPIMSRRACLLCVLALGHVAALQGRPDSRLSAAHPVLRATTLVATAAAQDEGKAGLSSSTANLVKSIVGSGVLSLPVGVAAFSSARTAILPAID